MAWKKTLATLLALSTVCAVATSCGGSSSTPAASSGAASGAPASSSAAPAYPTKAMEFIAPAGAGGGWDTTIRAVAKVLKDTNLVSVAMPVTNKPGGGGMVNLAYMDEKKGSDSIIAVYSPPLILNNLNGTSPLNYKDNTTPLAALITDYGCFLVGKDSPYKTLTDVMDALKKDIKSVKLGGASSAGSMDHLQFLKVAAAAGVENPQNIDYVSFQDGSATAMLLGGHFDVLTSGVADSIGLVESGDLRVLAITADERIGTGLLAEFPTCKEQGIDATFYNWRGLFGTAGMPEYAKTFWVDALTKMVETPEWKAECEKYGWDEKFMKGDDFAKFLDERNEEYKQLLDSVGMLKA
ncbi:MAG TPA: tripartite tricarboxylate transporter substrate binding protein [Clostridia bacterium]|nr:tripartite tricarboxylate transporter substrate binding protein [Clostridia bacterium]